MQAVRPRCRAQHRQARSRQPQSPCRCYGSLPPELQRDIKAFFGNHQNAIDSGQRLLFAIADTDRLTADAEAAFDNEIGWLEDDDYYVHRDELGRLGCNVRSRSPSAFKRRSKSGSRRFSITHCTIKKNF